MAKDYGLIDTNEEMMTSHFWQIDNMSETAQGRSSYRYNKRPYRTSNVNDLEWPTGLKISRLLHA